MSDDNNYKSVSTWRDEVSILLGGMKISIGNIEKKIDDMCKRCVAHELKIESLEKYNTAYKAVDAFKERAKGAVLTLIGVIAGVVGTILAL